MFEGSPKKEQNETLDNTHMTTELSSDPIASGLNFKCHFAVSNSGFVIPLWGWKYALVSVSTCWHYHLCTCLHRSDFYSHTCMFYYTELNVNNSSKTKFVTIEKQKLLNLEFSPPHDNWHSKFTKTTGRIVNVIILNA